MLFYFLIIAFFEIKLFGFSGDHFIRTMSRAAIQMFLIHAAIGISWTIWKRKYNLSKVFNFLMIIAILRAVLSINGEFDEQNNGYANISALSEQFKSNAQQALANGESYDSIYDIYRLKVKEHLQDLIEQKAGHERDFLLTLSELETENARAEMEWTRCLNNVRGDEIANPDSLMLHKNYDEQLEISNCFINATNDYVRWYDSRNITLLERTDDDQNPNKFMKRMRGVLKRADSVKTPILHELMDYHISCTRMEMQIIKSLKNEEGKWTSTDTSFSMENKELESELYEISSELERMWAIMDSLDLELVRGL